MRQVQKQRAQTWGGVFVWVALAACGSDDRSANAVADAASGGGRATGDDVPASPEEPAYTDEGDGVSLGVDGTSAAPAGESTGDPGVPSPSATPTPIPGDGDGDGVIQPGTLTAGAWDDNRNLDRFLGYRSGLAAGQLAGLPEFDEAAHRAAAARAAQPAARTTLDVALVIDTTGSMSDELSYLQSEFDALSAAIEAQYPGAEQRWALVVYRDVGDDYVARSFDFSDSAGTFREQLGAQSAGGGGDYPEASDAALGAMNQLSWRSDAGTARLAFWVADAPHHTDQTAALAAAINVAASQDVHVYPVASSGVDELTEYSMRAAAQLTLGRYLFLTDDSGVGGPHKEPTIPCYFVTRLDDAILRMVDIELTGTYREPEPAEVIRAGGDPANGSCLLESGQTVFVF